MSSRYSRASVQHAGLYKPNIAKKEKDRFIVGLTEFVRSKLLPTYKNSCSERQHYKNIKELIAEANRIGKKLLADDGYKYGVAQKLS